MLLTSLKKLLNYLTCKIALGSEIIELNLRWMFCCRDFEATQVNIAFFSLSSPLELGFDKFLKWLWNKTCYEYFSKLWHHFFICLPPKFLPASGPSERWCASTLGAALLWFGACIQPDWLRALSFGFSLPRLGPAVDRDGVTFLIRSDWYRKPEQASNLGPKHLSLLEFETWRLRPLGHQCRLTWPVFTIQILD